MSSAHVKIDFSTALDSRQPLAGDVREFLGPGGMVARHLAVPEIGLGIAEPCHQPVRVHFASDVGEFGSNVSANQGRECLTGLTILTNSRKKPTSRC